MNKVILEGYYIDAERVDYYIEKGYTLKFIAVIDSCWLYELILSD